MERAKTESAETKSQLVTEICNISNNAAATASSSHRRRCHRNPVNAFFIDWYLVLRVNYNADIDIIRKHYLRLALLLHPDKNNHPKAEFAFKLVLEAYICLSDNAKRKAFDSERIKINDSQLAFKCCTKTTSSEVLSSKKSKNDEILQRMKDLKIRFREEAIVIENCLRDYAPPRRSISIEESRTEYPVFSPPDHHHPPRRYPHMNATCYYKNTTQEIFYPRLTQSKKILTS